MITEVYPDAFAEVLFIIKCLSLEEQSKISPKFIKFLEENQNSNYEVNIDPNKALQSQQLLKETRQILREIYLDYFISKDQKRKILEAE